jgi:hypothetical protein
MADTPLRSHVLLDETKYKFSKAITKPVHRTSPVHAGGIAAD